MPKPDHEPLSAVVMDCCRCTGMNTPLHTFLLLSFPSLHPGYAKKPNHMPSAVHPDGGPDPP